MRKRLYGMVTGALLGTAAFGQVGRPPAPPSDSVRPGDPDRMRMRAEMEARHAEREARREADLALLLDLKASQRALLHGFLAAARPSRPDMDGPPPKAGPAGKPDEPSFGARLSDMQAHLDARTGEEQARLSTARAFYNALDTGQRAKFEAVQRLERPRRGPPPMWHRGPHGPRDGDGLPPPPPGDRPPPPPPTGA